MTAPLFQWDDAQAQGLFARLVAAGRDTRTLLETLAYSLTQRIALAFHDQTDPWGTPWTPLADATLSRRRDAGRSGVSILRDTGQLLASLTAAITQGTAEIRIGFTDRPATIHQFGGNAGRGHATRIPARPMAPIRANGVVDMPQSWRDELVDAMTAHVQAAFA